MDNDATKTPKNPPHYLLWLRRDLRLFDNTALAALCERAQADNAHVSAIFFLTPKQWLAHDNALVQVDLMARTLPKLAQDLYQQLNIRLTVQICPTFSECITAIIKHCQAQNITCVMANYEYEGNEIVRDTQLTEHLARTDIEFIRHHDHCILPPKSITTNEGKMYQVFTPFYKKWQHTLDISPIQTHHAQSINPCHHYDYSQTNADNQETTQQNAAHSANTPDSIALLCAATVTAYQASLEISTSVLHRSYTAQLAAVRADYPAGEVAACHRLDHFIADNIYHYNISRDMPSLQATSQLSAYLAIGTLSARHCYLQASKAHTHGKNNGNEAINRWISELAWRDFYRHVLVDKPNLIRHHAYKEEVDKSIDWSYHLQDFNAWCTGHTGVPLVDAAMRCLNATGFMHNRLRMVTAMFLTKDLLIDWRWGERYFMQQLIDGDFASNNGGWQWSASTGTDAAPYFRIMNPFSQAKTHDPDALFIKTWLPELKDLPATILHSEDKMRATLKKGGNLAKIGYPAPIIDHKAARLLAIAAFKK